MQVTRDKTERPHGALLQLDIGLWVRSVQDRWEPLKHERQLVWRQRWDTTLIVSRVLTWYRESGARDSVRWAV